MEQYFGLKKGMSIAEETGKKCNETIIKTQIINEKTTQK